MFKNIFKKKKNIEQEVMAIQSGKVVNISEVSDAMFAQKILGDGVGLIPDKGDIYSPVNGTVKMVANTKHAFGLETEDGIEILVHIGLETVELKGDGFETKAEVGDKVKVGDLLSVVDLELLKEKGYDTVIPIVITNMDEVEEIKLNTGNATEKETVIIEYIKKG